MFLFWSHGPNSLFIFLERLNSCYPIHFIWKTSSSHVTFLNINVQIDHGQFRTSVNVKPTNLQQYLQYHSCHPISTEHSIPYLPLGGIACVVILTTSTLTPPTSPKPSPPMCIQYPFSRKSYAVPSITRILTPVLCDPHHFSLTITYYPGLHC